MSIYQPGKTSGIYNMQPPTSGFQFPTGGNNQTYQGEGSYSARQESPYSVNSPRPRNTNSDTFASDTFADITRAEYADYKDRFQPYEKRLMSLAESEELLDAQLSRITATSKKRFEQSKANSALMNERYGVQQNSQQQNYSNTMNDASRGLAISQAKNMSRLAATDRKVGILSGAGSTRQLANQEGG